MYRVSPTIEMSSKSSARVGSGFTASTSRVKYIRQVGPNLHTRNQGNSCSGQSMILKQAGLELKACSGHGSGPSQPPAGTPGPLLNFCSSSQSPSLSSSKSAQL